MGRLPVRFINYYYYYYYDDDYWKKKLIFPELWDFEKLSILKKKNKKKKKKKKQQKKKQKKKNNEIFSARYLEKYLSYGLETLSANRRWQVDYPIF